jgi:hypothetical protein
MDERAELARLKSVELITYRNILLMGMRCLQVTDDPGRAQRHIELIEGLLRERGVRYKPAKVVTKRRSEAKE